MILFLHEFNSVHTVINNFLIGNAMDEDVEDFICHGADAVMTKPLKIDQLDKILMHLKQSGFKSKMDSNGRRYLF